MKCVVQLETGIIGRETDKVAAKAVATGDYRYINKEAWKEQSRKKKWPLKIKVKATIKIKKPKKSKRVVK